MTTPLEKLRRDARRLSKAHAAGDANARERLCAHPARSDGAALKHADFLHVIAREQGFESWPKLKFAIEAQGMDRAQKQQRLKIALYHGQAWVVERLLADTPDLAQGALGLQIALYDRAAVEAALAHDARAATRPDGPRSPILHLAFSRHIHAAPERAADMLAIAGLLVANGADVNDGYPESPGSVHELSALYGAIGHGDNMALAGWLLEHGADPDDGESLYHATELGHHEGLKLLLAHGAEPKGTNALLRAMDFNDHAAVEMLLAAGADPDEFNVGEVGGEPPFVIPALHQAARRMCDGRMARLLLEHGADPDRLFEGRTPYVSARVFGNSQVAAAIAAAGGSQEMSREDQILARAADGEDQPGTYIDPARLNSEYRGMIRTILHLPDKLGHVKRLVALGLEYDRPDNMGMTAVQVAGWEGLPDVMGYLLSLGPDLGHVNGYGGTLLSTIIHGSENCPERRQRDHIACARLALEHGVALPGPTLTYAGDEAMAAFLADWAAARPGQVVEGGAG